MPGFIVVILKILAVLMAFLSDFGKGPGKAALNPEFAVIPVDEGKIGNYNYSIVAGVQAGFEAYLQLKGNTGLHISMIGSKSEGQIKAVNNAKSSGLRKIHLEGDFPSYFMIFTKPDTEQETLQLLDPSTMSYIVDYCKSYHMEVNGSTVKIGRYLAAKDEDDKTSMLTDLRQLVLKNDIFFRKLEALNPIVEYSPAHHYKGTKPLKDYKD